MSNSLLDYFKCPDLPIRCTPADQLSKDLGYYKFGESVLCYGRSTNGFRSVNPSEPLHDTLSEVRRQGEELILPFDLTEVSENLRNERYRSAKNGSRAFELVREAYYSLRPFMPLMVRKHLQRIYLKNWREIPFPVWPVDFTVDLLFEKVLESVLKSGLVETVPFIWFWPEGASAGAIMTHDVEEEIGRQFCSTLMDIDDEFQVPASFQIVPEVRYEVSPDFLASIRERGFELNVQDLNHDGLLYQDYEEFVRRASKINQYGKKFAANGFRAGILYRNQDWYRFLDFEYDMSVPNVAHLDPQRGGCCTVMPYFIGDMLELPVTTTQDHSMFNVLSDFSLDLWKRQCDLILRHHGLISFIVHPDYLLYSRAQDTYRSLLRYLRDLQAERGVWIALPGEVNRWWRQRDAMRLVRSAGSWAIEGEGKDRARVAFASLEGGKVSYRVEKANSAVDLAKAVSTGGLRA